MKKVLISLMILSTLVGCGTRGYLKTGSTPQSFYMDYLECKNARLDIQQCLVMGKGYTISKHGDKQAYRCPNSFQLNFAEGLAQRQRNTLYLDVKVR